MGARSSRVGQNPAPEPTDDEKAFATLMGAVGLIFAAKIKQLKKLQGQLKEQAGRTEALSKLQGQLAEMARGVPSFGKLLDEAGGRGKAEVSAAQIETLQAGGLSLEQMQAQLAELITKFEAMSKQLPGVFAWLNKASALKTKPSEAALKKHPDLMKKLPDQINEAKKPRAAQQAYLAWGFWVDTGDAADTNALGIAAATHKDEQALIKAFWTQLTDFSGEFEDANALQTDLKKKDGWEALATKLRDMQKAFDGFEGVNKAMGAAMKGPRGKLIEKIKDKEAQFGGKQPINEKLLRKHFWTQVFMVFITLFDLMQTLVNSLSEGESVDRIELAWVSLGLNIALLACAFLFLAYTVAQGNNSYLGYASILATKFGTLSVGKHLAESASTPAELDAIEARVTVVLATPAASKPASTPPAAAGAPATATNTRDDEVKIDAKELLDDVTRNKDYMKRIMRESEQLGRVLLGIVLAIAIATMGLNAWMIDQEDDFKKNPDRLSLVLLIIAVLKGTSTVMGGLSSQQKLADKEATAGKLYGELRELAIMLRFYRDLPSAPEQLKRIHALYAKVLGSTDMKKLVGLLAAAPVATVIPKAPSSSSTVTAAVSVPAAMAASS